MRRFFARLIGDHRGGTAVEYGLILGLIVITMIPAFIAVAHATSSMWTNISNQVTTSH